MGKREISERVAKGKVGHQHTHPLILGVKVGSSLL